MMSRRKLLQVCLLIAGCFLINACATANYSPPLTSSSPEDYARTINKSYDATWKALISYAGQTFFGIENFEKESGLITLSFGASDPGAFVDGGQWEATIPTRGFKFQGNYVDWLTQYAHGKLNGRMNIVVTSISASKTKVTIHCRYVFTAHIANHYGVEVPNTWEFDSGGYDSIRVSTPARGTLPIRTLRPTYKAEQEILKALSSF